MSTKKKRTHWKSLTDPRYIGAYALPDGEDLVVTIDRVEPEEIMVEGGAKETHSIMYLQGQKPMILNATNSKSIDMLYGHFVEDWVGKRIALYASTARLRGNLVECLRIRPSVPADSKPPINAARFAAALKQVRTGSYPLPKLRAGFAFTDEQLAQLDALEQETAVE